MIFLSVSMGVRLTASAFSFDLFVRRRQVGYQCEM